MNEYDIYGIRASGAPADEFVSEGRRIASKISRVDSVYTIAKAIANTINKAFSEDKTASDYIQLASDIKRDLIELNIPTDKYYCTHCGVVLDVQRGFDPKEKSWICKKCG